MFYKQTDTTVVKYVI